MNDLPLTRRAMLGASAAALATAPAAANTGFSDDETFIYEIQHDEAEWRAKLAPEEYAILRDGETEWPKTSPLWQESRDGTYHCRGCELTAYEANWKVELDKGWVFFHHSVRDAVMTGIDGPVRQYGQNEMAEGLIAMVEIHCRRCGSHLGHYLNVSGQNLHCINGTALTFRPTSA